MIDYFENLIDKFKDPKVKFSHVTTGMVTEKQLNYLRAKYIVCRVPSGGDCVMYMVCKG